MSGAAPANEWDAHWEAFAAAAALSPAQRFRRRLVLSALAPGRGTLRVLDIGSGQGDLAADLRLRYPEAEVRGIDYSASGVEIASRRVPGATFIVHDLVDSEEPPAGLDGWASHAVCCEVLEHVDDPRRLLVNARRCLAPGCRLVVTVPGGPMSAFDRHIGHRRHFTAAALHGLLEEAGYRVEHVTTAGFPFFNLYRMVVIARGERLVADVAQRGDGAVSPAARVGMAVFGGLLRASLNGWPWGWQVAGVATAPE